VQTDLQNVFTPAAAIENFERFAGRQEQLDGISLALQSDGTQIVIYGNRGVGKSSLARQLASLARGDQTIIDRLTLSPHEIPDYLVISLECEDSIVDVKTLILRLLTEDTALAPWLPFRISKRSSTGEVGGAISVKVFSVSGKGSEAETLERDKLETDIYSVFSNAVTHILDSGVARSGVLFIIDEVDRIKDRTDLASIIRSRGSDTRVKFAIVGVGTTPQELILNHESIVRQISDGCVEMPPMSALELKGIFINAHKELEPDGFRFSAEAEDWIISIARGHPYYVHLLGKHALLAAAVAKKKEITLEIAKGALADIALKGTARIQETIYQKAIGHSYVRELILKTFASVTDDEINTTSVYQQIIAARPMDVSNTSVYVGNLVSEKFGQVIEKTRERHYRFRDSLFKAYAAARPFKYPPDSIDLNQDE